MSGPSDTGFEELKSLNVKSTLLGEKPEGGVSRLLPLGFFIILRGKIHEYNNRRKLTKKF